MTKQIRQQAQLNVLKTANLYGHQEDVVYFINTRLVTLKESSLSSFEISFLSWFVLTVWNYGQNLKILASIQLLYQYYCWYDGNFKYRAFFWMMVLIKDETSFLWTYILYNSFEISRNINVLFQSDKLLSSIMVRVFANGLGDRGRIPGRVKPKTQKMVLDASLLNIIR